MSFLRRTKWTTDHEGHYIVWNRPPHYIDGVVNLLLFGEHSLKPQEMAKRRAEFMKLQKRDLKRRKNDGPGS